MAINNNIHWIIDNDLEHASLTTTANCPPALGPDNLKIEDKSFIFKTTQAGEYDIIIHFNELTPISSLALLQHNADANTIYHITAYTGTDTNAIPSYDAGPLKPLKKAVWGTEFKWGIDPLGAVANEDNDVFLLVFAVQYFRTIKIHINDSQHRDNSTEIGRAFIGYGFQSYYNFDYGINFEDSNQAEITETGNGLTASLAEDKKNLRFALNHMDNDEHILLRRKLRQVKNHKDILISVYPQGSEAQKNMYTVLGKLVSSRKFKHDYYDNYQLECHIREN